MPIWSPAMIFGSAASGYVIENAIMLDAGSSDYLSRTPSSAGNRKTWTFSAWVKRGRISALSGVHLFGADRGSGYGDRITFGNGDTDDRFNALFNDAGSGRLQTKNFFRDPSAWTHFLVVVDTDQGGSYTAANAVKIYINGTVLAAGDLDTASYPAEDYETAVNNTVAQMIGARGGSASQFMDGYMAEVILLDGTAVSNASSFGEFDDNGVWVPIEPSGLSFGTNGFHLKFDAPNLLGKSSNSTTNPTVSFLGSQVFGSTAQTFTVSGATLGDAASNRTIVVAAGGALNNSGTRSISSLTVGGSSATFIARKNSGGGNTMEFWSVALSSGTSGDIVATFSGGNNNMNVVGIAWWRVLDVGQAISTDGDTGSSWSTQAVTTIGQTGDVALYALFDSGSITGFNWSDATERADHPNITSASAPATFYGFTAADYTFTAAESHTETVSPASGSGNDDSYIGITLSNNNSFTANSIAAANQVTDTCTDNAGSNIGNYATLNPLGNTKGQHNNATLSEGNLTWASPSSSAGIFGTIPLDQTKEFYWEVTVNTTTSVIFVGIASTNLDTPASMASGTFATYRNNGTKNVNASGSSYGASWSNGNVIGIHFDGPDDEITFYVNDSSQGAISFSAADQYFPFFNFGASSSASISVNFGQEAFSYTPKGGSVRLNTANLPAPTVTKSDDFFSIVLYEGNGSTLAVTGAGFQPDFLWMKSRSVATNWNIYDAVRTANSMVRSNTANTAQTGSDNELSSFDNDGFTVTHAGGVVEELNRDDETYVAYCLKANGTGSSNTDGNVTGGSTVSVASHNGFAIVTYGDCGGAAKTIGHGMGKAPDMIMVKNLTGTARTWRVYHKDLTSDYVLYLNTSEPEASEPLSFGTIGTSTFGVDGGPGTSANGETHVAYCFARTPGIIATGSYTGNGVADGPSVVVDDGASGFRPAWIMFKNASADGYAWSIFDVARDTFNPNDTALAANNNTTESTVSTYKHDILANGFKIRGGASEINGSGNKMIYLAFAENPFGGDTVAQARARG